MELIIIIIIILNYDFVRVIVDNLGTTCQQPQVQFMTWNFAGVAGKLLMVIDHRGSFTTLELREPGMGFILFYFIFIIFIILFYKMSNPS